ncbi:MAG: helix-turn-helix transcriptional regulator [Acidobacteria bacterium]|nr:helix-turn-helix transcriptional regulator [Acidobacteriota bacterium]
MGRAPRPKPERLAAKLLHIRTALGLTQDEMLKRLRYRKSPLYASQISDFEQGKREPPVLVLLMYARAAGVPMEWLVDDDLELPNVLPPPTEVDGIMPRRRAARRR